MKKQHVNDPNWVTLKAARQISGRGKTTIRNWIISAELPSHEEKGICMVAKDKLLALHQSKPARSSEKNGKKHKNGHRANSGNDHNGKSFPQRTMPVSALRPHPLSAEIYGGQHDARLLESVKFEGILSPLLVTADGLVVSGGERLWAAQEAGLVKVPVVFVGAVNEMEIKLMVLEANIARVKTTEQRVREYNAYKEIETERAEARKGSRTDLGKSFTPGESGKARDIAAGRVGWSGPTAEKGCQVLNAIEERSATENMQIVEEVRHLLNECSVDAAHRQAMELGWLPSSAKKKKEAGTPGRIAQRAFSQAKTAASKLAKIVAAEEIQMLSPTQIRELRDAIEPILKWVDGLGRMEKKAA